ncbi:MAG: leucine-rich repeat protein, partial [Clostridia bacterium]|nr:leucine-rich repeat protein [Clostridia bacterium]
MKDICRKCNAILPSLNYCSYCGFGLREADFLCRGCQRPRPTLNFCPSCGEKLETALAETPSFVPRGSRARENASQYAEYSELEYSENPDGSLTVIGMKNKRAQSVKLPPNVAVIGEKAFYGSDISDISLHEGLVLIDSEAFAECRELTVVRLPSTVSQISRQAFRDCSSLLSIGEFFPDNLTYLDDTAFE